MAYSESVLRAAEARLAAERQQHDDQNRARIAAIYEAQPRLREIDSQLRKTSARVMAACFRRGGDAQRAIEQLKQENLALQQERAWILESNELSPDDLADTPICPDCGGKKPEAKTGWDCAQCGTKNIQSRFCPNCGAKKPEESSGWTCPECGTKDIMSKFCPNCGARKPEEKHGWICPDCGTKDIMTNFCPNCGRKKDESC